MKLLQELTGSERRAEVRFVAHRIAWDITAYLARLVGSNVKVISKSTPSFL